MDATQAKQAVRAEVERLTPQLLDISHSLHANPELGFEEHHAHEVLSAALEDEALSVDRGAYELPTAFAARAGTRGPAIAVCCEYDALPEIGHACGHNVIAAAGLGAGLAAAKVADALNGRVAILGTPAEEGGGGKEFMLRRGAFDDVDAAMMVHPADHDIATMQIIACQAVDVTYHGKAAHAAAAPDQGRNALDAAVLGYNAVAALRQHIRPDERVHGIFTDAGAKPNIVPSKAAAQWYARSGTLDSLERLKERLCACLEAGAAAACCEMHSVWRDPPFFDMIDNAPLLELYVNNSTENGRFVHPQDVSRVVVGSTDMGNVSHKVPAIHPLIKVAPQGTAIHTSEFAQAARSELADQAVVDGAINMAMTIVDCWTKPEALTAIHDSFPNNE